MSQDTILGRCFRGCSSIFQSNGAGTDLRQTALQGLASSLS